MFNRPKISQKPTTGEVGLLGTDTRFEGAIRFTGTLRIDGIVTGDIVSEPGSGSVLVINQLAEVVGDIVSDSVLISGHVEGDVRARNRVEIYRSGFLKGDIYTADVMIEGGAEFQGYCHMTPLPGEGGDTKPAPGGNGSGARETPPDETADAEPGGQQRPASAETPGN